MGKKNKIIAILRTNLPEVVQHSGRCETVPVYSFIQKTLYT